MKKITKKSAFCFLLSAVVCGLGAYFLNSIVTPKKPSIEQKKPSIELQKTSIEPKQNSQAETAVNFIGVPLGVVITHFFETVGLSVLPGRHESALVTLSGNFPTKGHALLALRSALPAAGLELVGKSAPYSVQEKLIEPEFVAVDWGSSGGKILILYGSKWYSVSDFPFLLRRDSNGNFQAALPSVQSPSHPVLPVAVATVGNS